ncbi:MAG: response regulator [Pseudomonadota bacterium]
MLSRRDEILADQTIENAILEQYICGVEDIIRMATEYQEHGLEGVGRLMLQQLRGMQQKEFDLRDQDLSFLEQWLILLEFYLSTPDDPSPLFAMVDHLQDPQWVNPLSAEEGEAMVELLRLWWEADDSAGVGKSAPVHREEANQTESTPDISDDTQLDRERVSAEAVQHKQSHTSVEDSVAGMAEEVAGISFVAEQMELAGLQRVCLWLEENIEQLRGSDAVGEAELELLSRFPALASDYLASPVDIAAAKALIEYMQADKWPHPIRGDEANNMLFLLQDGDKDHAPAMEGKTPTKENLASFEQYPLEQKPVEQSQEKNPLDEIAQQSVQEEPQPEQAESVGNDPVSEEEVQQMSEKADPLPDEQFSAEIQSIDSEFITLLVQEFKSMREDLSELLDEALKPELTQEERKKALEHYAEIIQRIGGASQTVGLLALKEYLYALERRIRRAASVGLTTLQSERLMLLPGSLQAYLEASDDQSTCEGLIDLLRGDTWPDPPGNSYINALVRGLSMVQLVEGASDAEPRQTQANAQDVELALPDDLNQELLDGLLQEIPVHTSEFSGAIQRLVEGVGTLEDMDIAKRAAHTLKGAANTVGVKGIANLTHHVEDILVALSKHGVLPKQALAEMLSNSGDCLEAMGEAVMGTGPEPEDAVEVLQSVLDWANRIDREGIPSDDTEGERLKPKAEDKKSEQADSKAGTEVQSDVMVRVSASLIDELLRLMGETVISTSQVRERLRRLVQQNNNMRQQNQFFLQLANDLEELVDLRSSISEIGAKERDDEFDPLEFEHYSELHTVSRRLIEAATDAGEMSRDSEYELDELTELIEVQERLHTQSQSTVLQTRMLPVGAVASRLQRSVRQASRLLEKRVSLDVLGTDTMIDSNILNELVDPLMHMLRNAVDHGIEMPDQRQKAGKAKDGHIELLFLREGNQVVVRCRDDGAGLDLASLRQAAEERGIVTQGQSLSEDELSRLILTPGFSTKSESTQVSGRGIGMDVVHSKVLQLKGSLSLNSTSGKGLEIEIRLPATLISTYALLVRAQKHIFAISSYGIHDIHYVSADQVKQSGAETFFRLGEELYPLSDLCNMLSLPRNRRADDRVDGFPVLLVRLETGAMHAVRVQEILDSTELVVKGLGRFVPKLQGVVGATILGDGSVAAVIDLPEVMRKPEQLLTDNAVSEYSTGDADYELQSPSLRSALVVDDSLSARRATAQFMRDAGFEVRTAIDGLEAVSILEKWRPDILLVDMEMPRMNGLELTSHVRAREGMEHLPVIMITSRSTDKHRRQAEDVGVDVYITKPFGDGQLLQHVTELTAA